MVAFFPLVLGTAGLLGVIVTPFFIDVTVHARATAVQGGQVVVRGTVTCSIETTVSIEGFVVERLNRAGVASGEFFTEVACGTAPMEWTVVADSETDRAFRPGFATVVVRAVGFDPENGIFAGVESVGFLHLTRSAH